MNKAIILTLFAIPFLLVACVSPCSKTAKAFGYEKSTWTHAGPYKLDYGWHDKQTNADELVIFSKGNWDIFSKIGGDNDVYLDGLPFIHFERTADGLLTNLQMTLWDTNGNEKVGWVDQNADGQWDMKIDYTEGKIFTWTNGQWMFRYQMGQTHLPTHGNPQH